MRLKPLSLGRYRLLQRFGCAFVAEEEKDAGVPDLLLGLVICSMRVDEFLAAADSQRLATDVRRWGRRICPLAWIGLLPFVGKLWRKSHAVNVLEKMRLFKSYLEAGSVVPQYWEEEGQGQASGAHWSQSVEVTLRGELGWSEEEINETALSKALADYFKFAEQQGLVRLMIPYEIELIREAELNSEGAKAGSLGVGCGA